MKIGRGGPSSYGKGEVKGGDRKTVKMAGPTSRTQGKGTSKKGGKSY